MAALVLASANERLCVAPGDDLVAVDRALPRIAADSGWEYDYWRGASRR
jgi:hypothetical protein